MGYVKALIYPGPLKALREQNTASGKELDGNDRRRGSILLISFMRTNA